MKIAIITVNNPFGKISGGIESFVFSLSQALADIGHEVWVVCSGSSKREILEKQGKVNLWILPCDGRNLFTRSLRFARYSHRIIHNLEREGVVVFNGQGGLSSPLFFSRPTNGVICLTVHTLDGENIANIRDCVRTRNLVGLLVEIATLLFVKVWRMFYLSRADYLIFVSETVRMEFRKFYSFLKRKSLVIPNGYSTQITRNMTKKREYDFVYVGRLDKRKRVDWIVRASSDLVRKGYAPSISIIGIGPYQKSIATLVDKLDVSKNVSLLGYLPSAKVVEHICGSKFLLLPSMYEGDPLVIKEALYMGTPCIVSDIPSLTETIENGKNGFVFKGNHRQLSRSMEKALTMRSEDYAELSASASRSIEGVSWQVIAQNYSKVFEGSCNRPLK